MCHYIAVRTRLKFPLPLSALRKCIWGGSPRFILCLEEWIPDSTLYSTVNYPPSITLLASAIERLRHTRLIYSQALQISAILQKILDPFTLLFNLHHELSVLTSLGLKFDRSLATTASSSNTVQYHTCAVRTSPCVLDLWTNPPWIDRRVSQLDSFRVHVQRKTSSSHLLRRQSSRRLIFAPLTRPFLAKP